MVLPLRRSRRRPPGPAASDFHLPAPVGGINQVDPATAVPFSDALALYNMLAAEGGLRVRSGYREWCTGLTGINSHEVRSVISFVGSEPSKNKTFAATEDGIWDVTDSSAAPTKVFDFPTKGADAGWVNGQVTTTLAGHFWVGADESNGYLVYTESTDTWAKATAAQVTGVNPNDVVAVAVWKRRVWLILRNSPVAAYLDVDSIYGAATRFNFGTQFRAGGHLVGLWNWTRDGGAGMDDSLVAISAGGDVVIYEGTDPATEGFFLMQGQWSVGGVPVGRRIATKDGGDLLILTVRGVLPVSKLRVGAEVLDSSIYLTEKISPLVTLLMSTARNIRGWSIVLSPQDNALMITVPTVAPDASGNVQATTQLVYTFAKRSWSQYGPGPSGSAASRALPIYSAEVFDGKLLFGTVDGKVCIHDGYVDGVQLADPNACTDIDYALLSGCNNMGNARQKQVGIIRPQFLSGADAPAIAAEPRYNLDQSEVTAPTAGAAGANAWDTGVWDSALWGADQQAVSQVLGGAGIGVNVAIALRGKARSRTILVGFDVSYRVGGLL